MFIPHQFALHPSRIHRVLLLLSHAAALAGIGVSHIPFAVKGLFVLGVAASALVLWREGLVQASGLRITQSGQVELDKNGWQAVNIVGQPVVLPWLVRLTVAATDGKRHGLTVWPDSTGADSFRKLKVWLKWGYRP